MALDPDLAYLFALLSRLPDTSESYREFWVELDRLGDSGREIDSPFYLMNNLQAHINQALEHPEGGRTAGNLASYVLMFFRPDSPDLWKLLGPHVVHFAIPGDDQAPIGRRWVEDVCATAWRLYVRYDHDPIERLRRSWEDSDQHDWWSPR